MSNKSFYFLAVILLVGLLTKISYGQEHKTLQKINDSIKKIEFQPTVIIPYDEEDVDDLLKDEVIDSLIFGIGGDDLIPASDVYSTWSNLIVNPYEHEPISDTLAISLIGYTFPLLKFYRVNSEFGQRRRRYHYGIDLKVNVGDTVVSSFGGMVRIAQQNIKNRRKGYGYFVIVRHFNGLETFYAHLDQVFVKPDQMVTTGEPIGLGGNTGRSTGPHLHYELRYQGRPINPRDVIDFDSTLNVFNDTLLLTANHFVYPKRSSKVRTNKSTTASNDIENTDSKGIWKVKNGDTLSKIARRTGTSINRLCALNGITPNKVLRIGQKIKY